MENLICCIWALRRPSTIFASNTSMILWNGMIWYVKSIYLPVAGEEPIDSFWGKSRYRPSLDISKIHGKFWVTESELEMSSLQISIVFSIILPKIFNRSYFQICEAILLIMLNLMTMLKKIWAHIHRTKFAENCIFVNSKFLHSKKIGFLLNLYSREESLRFHMDSPNLKSFERSSLNAFSIRHICSKR